MKTTTIYTFLLLLFSAFSVSMFTSCDDDKNADTTPPIINLKAPAEGAVLKIGSDVHFDMEVSDDWMLASYKVEIHHNFDGHEHAATTKSTEVSSTETTAFFFQKMWSLAGQKNAMIHHHEIIIPENATPGNYHLMVYCTDAEGNESHVARNIKLGHDGEEHHH